MWVRSPKTEGRRTDASVSKETTTSPYLVRRPPLLRATWTVVSSSKHRATVSPMVCRGQQLRSAQVHSVKARLVPNRTQSDPY